VKSDSAVHGRTADGPAITPRRERTRERLLDAAFDVFARQGVQAASIEAVCDAAGFTRGAFYSNFASKDELFLALTERETRAQLTALEAAATTLDADAVTTRDGLRDAVRTVVASVMPDRAAKQSWSVMALEFELLALRDPQVAARYAEQQRQLQAELADVLVRLLDGLGLRFAVDSRVAVDLLLGAHEAGQRTAMLSGDDDRPHVLIEALVDLVIAPAWQRPGRRVARSARSAPGGWDPAGRRVVSPSSRVPATRRRYRFVTSAPGSDTFVRTLATTRAVLVDAEPCHRHGSARQGHDRDGGPTTGRCGALGVKPGGPRPPAGSVSDPNPTANLAGVLEITMTPTFRVRAHAQHVLGSPGAACR
jgi:AcrR family transcriptional regulator